MRNSQKNKKPHFFQKELAEKYGVDEAIMLNHIIFWISINSKNLENRYDNRTWMYCTYKRFSEYFSYWSESQVRRIINSLINYNVLISGNYNRHGYDQTKWYALYDEEHYLTYYNAIDRMDDWYD